MSSRTYSHAKRPNTTVIEWSKTWETKMREFVARFSYVKWAYSRNELLIHFVCVMQGNGSVVIGTNYGCHTGKLEIHSCIQYCSIILCRRKKKHKRVLWLQIVTWGLLSTVYCLLSTVYSLQSTITEALLVEMETVG